MPIAFGTDHSASTEVLPTSQTAGIALDVATWIPIWNRGWIARYNLTE
jgi:hypothetical protein